MKQKLPKSPKSPKSLKSPKSRFARYIAQLSFYAIPFYPLFKTYISLKRTIGTGLHTRRNLNSCADRQKKLSISGSARSLASNHRAALTFRQATAQRPADAISIEAVEYLCLTRKRAALAGGFLGLCFLLGSLLGRNDMGSLFGILSVSFCFLLIVKHDHRLWQIEIGRKNPDQALGDFRTFFAVPGLLWRLLNPKFSAIFNDIHR